jgi:hypothetical protein
MTSILIFIVILASNVVSMAPKWHPRMFPTTSYDPKNYSCYLTMTVIARYCISTCSTSRFGHGLTVDRRQASPCPSRFSDSLLPPRREHSPGLDEDEEKELASMQSPQIQQHFQPSQNHSSPPRPSPTPTRNGINDTNCNGNVR